MIHGYNNDKHPLYSRWHHMINRCYASHNKNYKRRGIKVCDEWKNDFETYAKWIIDNLGWPPKNTVIDRKNNDGNYEPGNLRWASFSLSNRNKRASNNSFTRIRGVYFKNGKYHTCKYHKGKRYRLGIFNNIEDAKNAVKMFDTELIKE